MDAGVEDGYVQTDNAIEKRRYVVRGSDGNHLRIVGGIVVTADDKGTINVLPDGDVVIAGNKIECVGTTQNPCQGANDATTMYLMDTDKIYPGLVNAHDHPSYNFCPLFEHAATYDHNSAWRASKEYDDWGNRYYNPNNAMDCQRLWYGLIVSPFGGATSIQGIGQNLRCLRQAQNTPLIGRMIDSVDGIRPDHVRTWTLGIDAYSNTDAQSACNAIDNGTEDRLMLHIGEGRRGNLKVEGEFTKLERRANGCLVDPNRAGALVMIHGNFTIGTLTKIAALGSPGKRPFIVWSPSSNTDLYGWNAEASLSVPDAMQLGMIVAIGTDWRPSRGIGMITELNVARRYATQFFPHGAVTDEDLFRMATLNAAKAAGLENDIGRIAPGMRADITIITGNTDNPFEEAYLGNVAATIIDGLRYYGDVSLMDANVFDEKNCEVFKVCDVEKKICVPPNMDGQSISYSRLKNGTLFYRPDLSSPDVLPYTPVNSDELEGACR